MLPLLLIAFIVVPIAELAVILRIGDAIGLWWTIGLLVADSVLGSLLMRSQGRAVWRRFNAALRSGRPPSREIVDGTLVILGGALLLTPGFLTDIVGLSLLLPPSRSVIRRVLLRTVERRMLASMATPRPRAAGPHGYDVEGTAVEVDPPR